MARRHKRDIFMDSLGAVFDGISGSFTSKKKSSTVAKPVRSQSRPLRPRRASNNNESGYPRSYTSSWTGRSSDRTFPTRPARSFAAQALRLAVSIFCIIGLVIGYQFFDRIRQFSGVEGSPAAPTAMPTTTTIPALAAVPQNPEPRPIPFSVEQISRQEAEVTFRIVLPDASFWHDTGIPMMVGSQATPYVQGTRVAKTDLSLALVDWESNEILAMSSKDPGACLWSLGSCHFLSFPSDIAPVIGRVKVKLSPNSDSVGKPFILETYLGAADVGNRLTPEQQEMRSRAYTEWQRLLSNLNRPEVPDPNTAK